MPGDFEALGDVATGAVLARAVEPQTGTGEASTQSSTQRACRNCAAPLTGPYCSACGQKAAIHRTLGEFGHDIAHGVFHFDGKIWRTLPLLAWRPGALTRRYIHGERAKFVSPFALFLFSVFLMVAVFSWAGPSGPAPSSPQKSAEQQEARAHIQAELARLRAARTAAMAQGKTVVDLDRDIAALLVTARLIGNGASGSVPDYGPVKGLKIESGVPALDALVRHGLENPQLTLYKVQSNAYKFSWALIPISLPFVWLLFFWRRDLHLFDHAVFVTYSIAFMTLLATACVLAIQVPAIAGFGGALLVFYPLFHMYRQLRGAYQIGRFGALIRTSLLAAFSATALLLFGALVLALGLSH